jgi:hypothetical protein
MFGSSSASRCEKARWNAYQLAVGLRHVSQSRRRDGLWNPAAPGLQFERLNLAPMDSTHLEVGECRVRTTPAAAQFLQSLESV